jgi:diguanylate cyclase (GGDEF)-like protein
MDRKKTGQLPKGLSIMAIVSFLVSLSFCAFLISATIVNRTNVSRLKMEQQIFERTHRMNEIISKLLYKTQSLSTIIIQGNGSMDSFDLIAPSIVDDPAIQNVLLAPNGIVAKVHPLAGNERILGWNFFGEGAGNLEAIAARDLGELVLGGPLDLVQGGKALVGRMPVYIDTPEEYQKFWGLVSITLKLSQIIEKAEFEIFTNFGYSYELWRINPDINEKQVIAGGFFNGGNDIRYIEQKFNILNAEWFLRVSPILMWYDYPENIALIIAGFCISFIVFFVMQNNHELKYMQSVFELMAITDPLTGVFNRRHFMEIVRINIEKARRHNETCYFIMFDIDKFKHVNDTYGHQIGDKVLMDVTARIKADIRPYDLFARYGGEEFIIFTTGISDNEVKDMVERLRVSLCSRRYEYDDVSFDTSASFGIAQMDDYNLDKAIKRSDDALYSAKRNGRNCVVFYSDKAAASA